MSRARELDFNTTNFEVWLPSHHTANTPTRTKDLRAQLSMDFMDTVFSSAQRLPPVQVQYMTYEPVQRSSDPCIPTQREARTRLKKKLQYGASP
jgi:hypothetical protein